MLVSIKRRDSTCYVDETDSPGTSDDQKSQSNNKAHQNEKSDPREGPPLRTLSDISGGDPLSPLALVNFYVPSWDEQGKRLSQTICAGTLVSVSTPEVVRQLRYDVPLLQIRLADYSSFTYGGAGVFIRR